MRRWLLAPALCVLSVLPAAALDRSAFAFIRYDLHATVDPHQHGLAVEGTIELRNRTKVPQRECVLQISSSLRWRAIAENGEPAEWIEQDFTSDIDHTGLVREAIVKPAAPVAPGGVLKLTVRYAGTVVKDATRLLRIDTPAPAALRSDWDEISDNFTALRGVGYVAWYPVAMEAGNLSEGNQLFDLLREWHERQYSTVLRVHLVRAPQPGDETGFAFIANTAEAVSGPEVTAEFHAEDPVIVLMEQAASVTDRPNVAAYFSPAHANKARGFVAAAETVIAPLEDWLGKMRRKAVIVELTDPNALPYDTGSYYFVPLRPVAAGAAEVALARPVAHAMVESPRPWIRDGLAGFAQALVRERQAGHPASLAYMRQFLPALAVAEKEAHATAKDPAKDAAKDAPASGAPALAAPQPLVTTTDQVYLRTKSAFVWWMLRDMVGDAALQAALAHYRAADDLNPAYLQKLIEAQAPAGHRELETFFDDWVYRDRGLPLLKVESTNIRKTLDEQTVTAVTVENLGDVWCEVPVTLRSGKGENSARVVVPAHGKATVRIPFQETPAEVEVNDGSVPEAEPRETVMAITTVPAPAPPRPEPPPPPTPQPVKPGPL